MKRLTYIAAMATAMTFAACSSVDDYRNYVDDMQAQLARLDTVSTQASYIRIAQDIESLNAGFTDLGIDLNEEQRAELSTLQQQLQQAFDAKYQQLMTAADTAEQVAEEAAADMD